MDSSIQTALVTGGSRGIGAGIVKSLVKTGFKVIIADLIQPEYYNEFHDQFTKGNLLYYKQTLARLKKEQGYLSFVKKIRTDCPCW